MLVGITHFKPVLGTFQILLALPLLLASQSFAKEPWLVDDSVDPSPCQGQVT